jgi:hypothetical protein
LQSTASPHEVFDFTDIYKNKHNTNDTIIATMGVQDLPKYLCDLKNPTHTLEASRELSTIDDHPTIGVDISIVLFKLFSGKNANIDQFAMVPKVP